LHGHRAAPELFFQGSCLGRHCRVCLCLFLCSSSIDVRTDHFHLHHHCLIRVAHMAEARFQTTQLPCSVDLDQLAQECRDLPTRPSYSLSIQPDAYQVVKKRCADVINASDPQNQAITTEEADHAWKCRRMSQGLELKKQAASRTPASFSFDTYVQNFVSHSQLRKRGIVCAVDSYARH